MNIQSTSTKIYLKTSPFYQCELLRPFIDAYFLNEKIRNKFQEFELFKGYIFGEYSCDLYINNKKWYIGSGDVFIGFRFLSRKFHPFFISLSERSENEFEINGFSTLTDEDKNREYYQHRIPLNKFKKGGFTINIPKDDYYHSYNKELEMDSLYGNFKKMSKKTLEKNKKIIFKNQE